MLLKQRDVQLQHRFSKHFERSVDDLQLLPRVAFRQNLKQLIGKLDIVLAVLAVSRKFFSRKIYPAFT